jgi:3-methyladenine DNA glycosylase/8-oxoguanine DNA glycosylase
VDFWRTVSSHGLVFLPPTRVDESEHYLEATLQLGLRARTVRVRADGNDAVVEPLGRPPGEAELTKLRAAVRRLMRLDEDLSEFYELAESDRDLHWAGGGAARLIRGQSVFEEVVKTICTTNCSWSATVRMVSTLVEQLGEPAPSAPANGPLGRTFPTPAVMAAAPESFYRDEMRCGYRGAFLRAISSRVASGDIELESMAKTAPDELSDDELQVRLMALPGVGVYAAAHIMLLLGRYSRLVLDSWTRPKYAKLVGQAKSDRQIQWRFRRFGRFAGLAFWLYVTQDWVNEPTAIR